MSEANERSEDPSPEKLLVRRVSESKFYAMVFTGAAQGVLLVLASRAEWWLILTVLGTGVLHILWFRDAMWGNRNVRPRGQITNSLYASFLANGFIQVSYIIFAPVNGTYVLLTTAVGVLAFLLHAAVRYMSSKVASNAR